ncbi:MAG TPA: feruloyl-CoA synthase [Ilumatobacteraceae bacterium]|nr:feruloyl-CoA synthase [Ilumatobacteraceae bacterium]
MSDSPTFATPDVEAERRDDGAWILRSRSALGVYEPRIGTVLEDRALATPHADLLCERDGDGTWRRVTYREAWDAARSIGQALLDRGLEQSRPVMVLSGNSIDHGLLMLACYVAGVPIVPVSVAYSLQSTDHSKLRHIFQKTRPGLIFATPEEAFAPALASLDLDGVDVTHSLTELRAAAPGVRIEDAYRATGPDTIAKYLFTSGSTGLPKGVINTHRMLCSNQQQAREVWLFLAREPVVLVDWLPWSHTFGGNHNFNLVLWSGGTMHIDAGRPVPGLVETTVRNLREVSPTAYFNVPAGFAALVPFLESDADLATRFFARVRLVVYAAAALPAELWERLDVLARRFAPRPVPLTASWGSTETAPLATSAHFPLDGPGCIGVPVPGVELKMVPNGRKLELRVKGPNVTPGYVGEPDLTRAAFDSERFYCMGDAGRFVDPDRPERGIVFDGRVAEDFKLTTGTWVSVGTLRTALVSAGAGAITDAVLTGHDRHEVGALVWLSPVGNLDALRGAIEKHNADNSQSSTRIARVLVLGEPPSIDGHEITDKGYINQRAVLERRAADVARLHAADAEADDVVLFP